MQNPKPSPFLLPLSPQNFPISPRLLPKNPLFSMPIQADFKLKFTLFPNKKALIFLSKKRKTKVKNHSKPALRRHFFILKEIPKPLAAQGFPGSRTTPPQRLPAPMHASLESFSGLACSKSFFPRRNVSEYALNSQTPCSPRLFRFHAYR